MPIVKCSFCGNKIIRDTRNLQYTKHSFCKKECRSEYMASKRNERFAESFEKKENGCWIWTGAKDGHGYGQFRYRGKQTGAHRISWEIHNGKIPRGMCVLHKCDNPACVNPEHLWIGTQKDNVKDMLKKGRYSRDKKTRSYKLNRSQVIEMRRLFKEEGYTKSELSKLYKVSQTTSGKIINRKTWSLI